MVLKTTCYDIRIDIREEMWYSQSNKKDLEKLAKWRLGFMKGLVLEGGTMRPIFSSGVMDALLTEDILLPYCIGVSAGIADGVSYISKQKGRNLDIVTKYRNDKRYMGAGNYRR